jgi:hypothetical protein
MEGKDDRSCREERGASCRVVAHAMADLRVQRRAQSCVVAGVVCDGVCARGVYCAGLGGTPVVDWAPARMRVGVVEGRAIGRAANSLSAAANLRNTSTASDSRLPTPPQYGDSNNM